MHRKILDPGDRSAGETSREGRGPGTRAEDRQGWDAVRTGRGNPGFPNPLRGR